MTTGDAPLCRHEPAIPARLRLAYGGLTSMPWREHPAAREDLDALAWCADQEVEFGHLFVDALDSGIDFIRDRPDADADLSF
ncbi:hypothetical protein [Granulicoccus sp. GXG6511]|uniref:hypothetical protein n=1 Tax=Granulicoccus sp. GXG6511 TaxID=3381351 RepID=UPI003D7CB6A5